MQRKSRRNWIVTIAVVALAALLLFGWAQETSVTEETERTVEELYALLVTEDGQSRLDVLESQLTDMQSKVDLIYVQAKEMMEEEGWQLEKQAWTLNDIKAQLDTLETKINHIYAEHGGE